MQDSVEIEDQRFEENHHVLIDSQTMVEAASKHTHLPVRSSFRVCDKFAYLLESMSPPTVNGAVLPRAGFLRVQRRFMVGLRPVNDLTVTHKACKINHEFRADVN